MITLFDLREKQDNHIYEAIGNLYSEPLNKIISLRDHSIKACIGCWSCWLKTPGECVMKDKMTESYASYINSTTVIILMDTAQGFINYQAKAFFDRTIPHYHPYIEIIDGECHHVARYKSYPDMVFYYDNKCLTNQEEQAIEDYLYRTAYQFKSKPYRIVKNDRFQLRLMESRKAKRHAVTFASTEPMEKLVIYNGSPRKSGSNSTLILNKAKDTLGERVEIRDLKRIDKWKEWAEAFKDEQNVMFFMPLYVHAMPSHVKAFIEMLQASKGSLSFFVQSGFPESSHSHYLEAYFEQLTLKLTRTYLGTAIKGGVEGLQMRPPKAQDKMIEPMVKTIENLVDNGSLNLTNLSQLAKPVQFSKVMVIILKYLPIMINCLFWDRELKKNSAYEKRFARLLYVQVRGESS